MTDTPRMLASALPFVIAFVVSLALVPLCKRLATRLGVVAAPRADRWHARPTAMLGGVAIAVSVLGLHALVIGFQGLPVLLVAAAAMFTVGLVDDVASLKPVTKLVFEIAIASFLVFFNYRLGWVTSLTADTVLTVFWIVGLTNAFNLLDNMDGLCAGLSIVAASVVYGALRMNGVSGPETTHLALLIGATAGFLVFNFYPASIFMGDSGSLFLGLNLSVLTLNSPGSTHAATGVLSVVAAPALILLVPILDTTMVTVSRLLSGRSAAQGGRDHSSHRLVAMGLSERAAVFVLWSLAGLGGGLALALKHYTDDLFSLAAAVFVLAAIIFMVYLARVRVYDDDAALLRKSAITPIVVEFVYRRRIAEVLLDLCLVAITYYTAYRLRFGGDGYRQYFPLFLQSLPLVLGAQLVSLFATDGYRGFWQSFGLMDAVAFAKGIGLGTLVSIGVLAANGSLHGYSFGVFVIYAALLMLLMCGSRASFRLMIEFVERRNQFGMRLVIYGAGDAAASTVRDILNRRLGAYRMLGFIAEEPSMERARMQGYPVLGNFDVLMGLVTDGKVDLVVLTQPIDADRLERLRSACAERNVSLERLHVNLDPLVAGARTQAFSVVGGRRDVDATRGAKNFRARS